MRNTVKNQNRRKPRIWPALRAASLAGTVLLTSGASTVRRPAATPDTPDVAELEGVALEMVNRSRAEENLPPLAPDDRMAAAARRHSEEMRDLKYMDHVSPTERYRTWTRRLALAGVSDATTGENVGFYASNSRGLSARDFVKILHRNLMKSPRHRANILSPKYTTAGIGLALGERAADEDPSITLPAMWITQNFARREADAAFPAVSFTGDGLLVTVSGKTDARHLFVSVRDSRDLPLEELKVDGGRFEKQLTVPFRDERVRIELCVPSGRSQYRVVNAWEVDTSARPEGAVRAWPADER